MELLGVLLFLIGIGAIVYLVIWLIDFVDSYCDYISWRKFIKHYKADPDKWVLRGSCVYINKHTGDDLDFAFGPIGLIIYKWWCHKNRTKEINKKLEEIFGGHDETSI